jgi:hypothetical protein
VKASVIQTLRWFELSTLFWVIWQTFRSVGCKSCLVDVASQVIRLPLSRWTREPDIDNFFSFKFKADLLPSPCVLA